MQNSTSLALKPAVLGEAEKSLLEIVAIWLIGMGLVTVLSPIMSAPASVACYVEVQVGPMESVVYQGRGVVEWGS